MQSCYTVKENGDCIELVDTALGGDKILSSETNFAKMYCSLSLARAPLSANSLARSLAPHTLTRARTHARAHAHTLTRARTHARAHTHTHLHRYINAFPLRIVIVYDDCTDIGLFYDEALPKIAARQAEPEIADKVLLRKQLVSRVLPG